MFKKLFFYVFLNIVSVMYVQIFAQRGLFLLPGVEIGTENHYKFQQHGNVLQKGWQYKSVAEGTVSPNATLHLRFSKKFGTEFGMQLSETGLLTHDQGFLNRNNLNHTDITGNNIYTHNLVADSGCFGSAKYYYSFHLSGYYFLNSKSWINPYFGGGISANIFTLRKNLFTASYYHPATNENLSTTIRYAPYYTSLFLEAGLFLYHKKRVPGIKEYTKGPYVFISAKYYFGGNVLAAGYANSLNGNVQYTDHVTVTGQYLGISLRIGGRILKNKIYPEHHAQGLGDVHSKSHPENKTPLKNKTEQDTLSRKGSNIPKELSNREIVVIKAIDVKKSKITLKIWDNKNFDGDILSLNLNNKWVLENYVLKEAPKVLTVHLNKGSNYLVLHSISEGTFAPCTAAVLIDDGHTKQEIIMDSNLATSEAIIINYTE